jgi:ssDNA-binding Zn-finger/Zn-ribbon topoisomerase 1
MMIANPVEGNCPDCGSDEVYYSTKRDSTIWKVYGSCEDCGRDHGRIATITNASNPDQAAEQAKKKARNFFN